jgi:hypothetical protein
MRGDVDLVKVGALFAVELDGNEMGVEDLRHRLVVEAFLLHHMAPVACGIADREEYGEVQRRRLGQRLGAEGAPIDRVVGMLDQIGRGLEDQPVDVFRRSVAVQEVGAGNIIRAHASIGLRQTLSQRRVTAYGGRVGGHGGSSCGGKRRRKTSHE